jgi:hypothetical protein
MSDFERIQDILNNGWSLYKEPHVGYWGMDDEFFTVGPYNSLEELLDNVELYMAGSD